MTFLYSLLAYIGALVLMVVFVLAVSWLVGRGREDSW